MNSKHGYKVRKQNVVESINVSEKNDIRYDKETVKSIIKKLNKDIEAIIAVHGLDDSEWANAISSQYFLLSIAKNKGMKKKDYDALLNKCLSSFTVTYTGDLKLDDSKLLVTPEETTRIIECMKQEDAEDGYYTQSGKMKSSNIDGQKMYYNYHYGLLIRIVSLEMTKIMKSLKERCLSQLFDEKALDTAGGWYPYRVPWITGRILISLSNACLLDDEIPDNYTKIISEALDSLYRRINKTDPYWRSGGGTWVTKWESTALCLEALFVQNDIREEVELIIRYVCDEASMKEWICIETKFDSEEHGNAILAGVILGSVVLRITSQYYEEYYCNNIIRILKYFEYVIEMIRDNENTNKDVRQYCTIPQVLYYVQEALDCINIYEGGKVE